MKDQEINIAIAEVLGWKIMFEERGIPPNWKTTAVEDAISCPDYCHDLNAMHEAESSIVTDQKMSYVEQLTPGFGFSLFRDLVHITARQRAEAFLRVKGLWKE